MKLTILCLLLCCGSAGAQTKPIRGQATICIWDGNNWMHIEGSEPDAELALSKLADKVVFFDVPPPKQLICDWQTDHWYCPTREAVATENTALLYGNTVPVQRFPPFDVPPIHKAGQLSYTCADASRFYLEDEGGRGHCLALLGEGRKDQ